MTMSPPDDANGFKSFLSLFFHSNGSSQILVVSTVYAIGIGSVLGLVPQTLTNRYARINHGFQGNCHDYATKPPECQSGSEEAQSAAAWSHVGLSMLLLLINPIFSSISDQRGRKPILLLALALSCIPAFVFYLIVSQPNMHPKWYYISSTLIGIVNYLGIAFAGCSDVIPEQFRASAFGILLAGYFGGYSLAPSMTLIISKDVYVALFSLLCSVIAFVITIRFVPETLQPPEIQSEQQQSVDARQQLLMDETDSTIVATTVEIQPPTRWDKVTSHLQWIWLTASRPIREISILRRNKSLQMVSLGCFCAAMVFSIDATFVIYYIEQKFDVQKSDIAMMTLALGMAGIVIQGVLVHPIVSRLGEKGALILAFSCGICHNFLYGYARTKLAIYAALIISQLTKTNIPLVSSIASKQVASTEQGRIQGAIFAITAIGNAVGPILVRFIYRYISPKLGSGSMFIYASVLYVIGTIVVSCIPATSSMESIPSARFGLEYEEEESSLTESLIIAEDNEEEIESADPGTSYDAI